MRAWIDRLPLRFSRLALVLLLAAQSTAVVVFWAWQLFSPHAIERTEVPVLINVLWWKAGLAPYSFPDTLPLIQNPYGPVFQWLCSVLPALDGQPYLVGRVISVLSMIGIGFGMAVWLRREKASWPAVGLASMLVISTKPWILFGPLYRVDALAVLLSFLGLLLVVHRRSRWGLAFALVLFGAGISVKLTAVAAPAAAILYLWTIDRRRSFAIAAGVVLLFPGIVFLMQWVTDGAYLFNAAFGNEPVHVLQAIGLPSRVLLSLFWLLGLAAAIRRVGLRRGSARSAAALYAGVSLATAALFSLNPIASWNYLLEVYLALGLLSGSVMAGLWDRSTAAVHLSRASALLAIHAVVALVVSLSAISKTRGEILEYRGRYGAARERLAPLIRDGRKVLILGSLHGRDALAGLGQPNAISMPAALEFRPEVQSLIRRLVPESDYGPILSGDSLDSWLPESDSFGPSRPDGF